MTLAGGCGGVHGSFACGPDCGGGATGGYGGGSVETSADLSAEVPRDLGAVDLAHAGD